MGSANAWIDLGGIVIFNYTGFYSAVNCSTISITPLRQVGQKLAGSMPMSPSIPPSSDV